MPVSFIRDELCPPGTAGVYRAWVTAEVCGIEAVVAWAAGLTRITQDVGHLSHHTVADLHDNLGEQMANRPSTNWRAVVP